MGSDVIERWERAKYDPCNGPAGLSDLKHAGDDVASELKATRDLLNRANRYSDQIAAELESCRAEREEERGELLAIADRVGRELGELRAERDRYKAWADAEDTLMLDNAIAERDSLRERLAEMGAVLSTVRRALPDRPPGHLDHAFNEHHDISELNYHMNVTRGRLHAAYVALEQFEEAALTAPASKGGSDGE